MNALRNRVQLIGNLGTDPEVKTFESGSTMAKICIATTELKKDAKGERTKETMWHNIIAWGNVATNMEKFLKKGCEVAIEGKLVNRSYEDKDGKRKYITEIVANEFILLDKHNN